MPFDHATRLMSTVDVAAMLGWSTERAHDWMIREKIAFKMGRRYYTTPTKLREAFPDIYEELALSDA